MTSWLGSWSWRGGKDGGDGTGDGPASAAASASEPRLHNPDHATEPADKDKQPPKNTASRSAVVDRGAVAHDDDWSAEQRESIERLSASLREHEWQNDEQRAVCDVLLADGHTVARFLISRQWQHDAALQLLVDDIVWRADYRPYAIRSSEAEVAHGLALGKIYVHSEDTLGRPNVYMRMHTKPDGCSDATRLRVMIYIMELACRRMDEAAVSRALPKRERVSKMVWVVNCQNYTMKYNGSMKAGLDLLSTIQNHYPERLGCFLLVDAPWAFATLWNVAQPFIEKKTKEKVMFVKRAEVAAKTKEWHDAERIEIDVGGTLVHTHDAAAMLETLRDEEQHWSMTMREHVDRARADAKKQKAKEKKKAKRAAKKERGDDDAAAVADDADDDDKVVDEKPKSKNKTKQSEKRSGKQSEKQKEKEKEKEKAEMQSEKEKQKEGARRDDDDDDDADDDADADADANANAADDDDANADADADVAAKKKRNRKKKKKSSTPTAAADNAAT